MHHPETTEESFFSQTTNDVSSLHDSQVEDSEGGFEYPIDGGEEDEEDEEFVYPGNSADDTVHGQVVPESFADTTLHNESDHFVVSGGHPSPAQLGALSAAASDGDLALLKKLFATALQSGNIEAFALANDASFRTGFTVLHVAASRGYLHIVEWLIEHCGAMPDLEDREGETALHKAALQGHISIIKYLLPDKAGVHARDADGWTALHNACSKGYIDIVKWLCESGGAANEIAGVRGVDLRSNGGWTPLMNAASKGHLPVVLYLLTKQRANPLVRNNWGETAYDAAAAVFEVWICEVLHKSEAERWCGSTTPYNPLSVHTTVPLVIYENERLDTRLKTLAISGGKPVFSASGLGRRGRHAPFELKLPAPDEEADTRLIASRRTEVRLPLLENPWVLPNASQTGKSITDDAERSHFWLSDWSLDVTHPAVNAETGWQYARNFDAPEEAWMPEPSQQLERILTGNGAMTAGLTFPGRNHTRSTSTLHSASTVRPSYTQTWVRRRRWVRVMRRRPDIPPFPFMEPDGALYHLATDGSLIRDTSDQKTSSRSAEGQELDLIQANLISSGHDYVCRARYLVGNESRYTEGNEVALPATGARRAISKLERATTELRQGIISDEDAERRTQAEVLLNAYSRELERRRLSTGAMGSLIVGSDDEFEDDDCDDDDDEEEEEEEFCYPGYSPPRSVHAPSASTDRFLSASRLPIDLTPHLTQAPEFRVPTHEVPQKMIASGWQPIPHQVDAQWERDDSVSACNRCRRRFSFIIRRHCRKCGRIFCDRCSSYRSFLDPSDIVHDPALPESTASSSSQRVCQSCFDEINAGVPVRFQNSGSSAMERVFVDQARLMVPGQLSRQDSSSQLSDLAECPVCGVNLADLGLVVDQEVHVKSCLEGGAGSAAQSAKYLVYKLPAESALLGVECVICLEEFIKGSLVARLSCFCSFHNTCLSSWLQRGRSCPVHAR